MANPADSGPTPPGQAYLGQPRSPLPAPVGQSGVLRLPPGIALAPLGVRFVAYLIDTVIGALVGVLAGLLFWFTNVDLNAIALISLALSTVWALLLWWMFAVRAAGPGMRLMRLQLVGIADGRAIGWGRFFVRQLILVVLAMTGIGLLLMVIFLARHPLRQGWHDLAVNSVVIRERRASSVDRVAGRRTQSGLQSATPPPGPSPIAGVSPAARVSPAQPQHSPVPLTPPFAQPQGSPAPSAPPPFAQPQGSPAPSAPPPFVRPQGSPAPSAPPPLTPPPGYAPSTGRDPFPSPPSTSAPGYVPPGHSPFTSPLPPQSSAPAPTTRPPQQAAQSAQSPAQSPRPGAGVARPWPPIRPTAAPEPVPPPGSPAAPVGPASGRPVPASSEHASWRAVLDDGRTIAIDGLVLLGRNPQPRPGEEHATLIKIADTTRTVSKSHLEIGLNSRGLYVVDRGSTNGSTVTGVSGVSRRCAPGDPVDVEPGSIVSFGDHWFEVRRN